MNINSDAVVTRKILREELKTYPTKKYLQDNFPTKKYLREEMTKLETSIHLDMNILAETIIRTVNEKAQQYKDDILTRMDKPWVNWKNIEKKENSKIMI